MLHRPSYRSKDLRLMCLVPECSKPIRCKGYCAMHYARVVRNGDPHIRRPGGPPKGWRSRIPGEPRYVDKQSGYVTIWDPYHPHANPKTGCVKEHIYVMTNHLKRSLTPSENIHHKNGDRSDNRLENLELWDRKQPPGQRVEDKIKHYISFLKDRGYKVEKTCE